MTERDETVFDQLDDVDIPAAIESVLFAAGDPVSADKLADISGLSTDRIRIIMEELISEYLRNARRGIMIRRIEDSYSLATKPSAGEVIKRLFAPRNRPPMTQAAYETLAIVAYNQPVTRSQIEAVRGVNSDGILSRLIEKELIHECGTLDAPGRPALFETTENFLKEFGLSSVRDLPPMDMLMYKTLQDIEGSVADATSGKTGGQITIEQLVDAVKPYDESVDVPPESKKRDFSDEEKEKAELSDESVMEISAAFFGEE